MIDLLLQLDYQVFHLLNGILHNAVLDAIIPFWREKYFWAPLYLFLLTFLAYNYRSNFWVIVLFAVITVVLSDQLSSGLIKPLVNRLRPCNDPSLMDTIRILVPCGGGKSFVSSHATNHFAIVVYFIMLFGKEYKRLLPIGLLWAASIAYGQVYVGVHFPLDIFAGAILGILIGRLTGEFAKRRIDLT
ncbi:MAG: phosphatase PAP2 family protein [Chitinophagales bacterium]